MDPPPVNAKRPAVKPGLFLMTYFVSAFVSMIRPSIE